MLIPGHVLSNIDLLYYGSELALKNFRGVFMRNTLPKNPRKNECGIVNLNTDRQNGTHWVAWFKKAENRFYFDSFAQDIPEEVEIYLKSAKEYADNDAVVLCNSVIVQHLNTSECGRLCLFVLKCMSENKKFDDILQSLKIRYDDISARNNGLR